MTEDDTFRVLARPSPQEMKELQYQWIADWCRRTGKDRYPSPENLNFAKHYGWEWSEYLIALKRCEGR